MNSRFAITALAGLVAGGLSITSASAADLGGNCCADLEERIAELEATTVRKGNRKVSVQLSGFVAHQVMFWDDGRVSDMYIGDGGNYGSRFRFKGSATIRPGLTAGFLYEFGINNNSITSMNQTNGGDDLGSGVSLRDSTVWIADKRLGKIKIGHGSTATDNLILIDLGNTGGASTSDFSLYGGGMFIWSPTAGYGPTWRSLIVGFGDTWDSTRRNHVMYETPSLAGFTLQAAVAEDNYWDIALRYANEWNGVRVAFGLGYARDSEFNLAGGAIGCTGNCDTEVSEFKGSASILHVPSGLFVSGAWGTKEISGNLPPVDSDGHFWHIQGGISRNFTGLGNTVIFGEYGRASDLGGLGFFVNAAGNLQSVAYDVNYWGIGLTQHVDAAAMEVFVAYKNFSLDYAAVPNADDLNLVIVGTKISF